MLNLESDFNQEKRKVSQKEKEAIARTADLLEKAESLFKENGSLVARIEAKEKEWREKEEQLRQQLQETNKENQQLMQKLLRISKGKNWPLLKSRFSVI